MAHCSAMIYQQVTLSGEAEWPKVADAVIEAQSAMGRQQGIACDLRAHLAVAQDEMRQDREYGFAGRALDAPDGDPTQTDAHIMRVARQASPSAAGRLVLELKAK